MGDYDSFASAFGKEQEPHWIRTLKADIRLIIKSELAQAPFLSQNLHCCTGTKEQPNSQNVLLSQVGGISADVSANKALTREVSGLSAEASANDVWKDEWRQKQTERMSQKLSKSTLHRKQLPFPAHQVYQQRKSFLDFIASRPVPNTTLTSIVRSNAFIGLFFVLIILNAFWMGYEAHVGMKDTSRRENTFHVSMKWFFGVAFTIEICMKLLGLQWQFINGDDWRWNVFDCLMVCLSIPNLFGLAVSVTFARALKLIRMVRVLRLFRVVQAFRELRHMIVAVHGSLVTLFWCAVLFIFGMFCFAVMIMQSASQYIDQASTPHELEIVVHLQKKYGSMQQSMLTLFHTVSGGDWLVAAHPLEEVFEGYNYFFALYIFFMSIGFLNVIIGLFCERAAGAVESDRDLRTLREIEESDSFIQEMRDIFYEMDTDNTGEIDWHKFEHYITAEGTGHFLRSHGIATHDAWELFVLLDEIDDNPSGTMDVVSFVMGMQRLAGNSCGTDIVLLIVEHRKRARTVEALIGSVRDQVATEFEQLRKLLTDGTGWQNKLTALDGSRSSRHGQPRSARTDWSWLSDPPSEAIPQLTYSWEI